MKDKVSIEGRSFLLNAIFVAVNLIGLTFVAAGYHESAEGNATLYKSIGWIMMMLSIGGLIIFKGKLMMANISRILVGGLFIVSGLVKANDPVGFSYKLEEYFEDGALAYRIKEWFGAPGFSLEWFIEHALFLSVLICIAEIVLGVLTIIGGKIKLVSYLMLGMMVFFTFLTWHTSTCDNEVKFLDHDTYLMSDAADAYTANMKLEASKREAKKAKNHAKLSKANKWEVGPYRPQVFVVSKSKEEVVIGEWKTPQCVDDCGCFGDALKGSVGRSLTPSESLWKDIVLLYLVIWIFLAQWIIKPNTRKENLIMGLSSMLVVIFFSWVFGWYFPILFGGLSILGALWALRMDRKPAGRYFGLLLLVVNLCFLLFAFTMVYGGMSTGVVVITLLIFIAALILYFKGGRVMANHWSSMLIVTNLCFLMILYVLLYEPIKDYRPYAVGANLEEKMNDGVDGQYESVFVYENAVSGKIKEMTEDEYMASKIWEDSTWVYKSREQRTIVAAVNASIMDFNPIIEVANMTDDERNCVLVKNVLDTSMTQTLVLYNKEYDEEEELPLEEYVPEYYPAEMYDIRDTLSSLDPNVTEVAVLDGILKADKIVLVVSKKLDDGSWESSMDRIRAIQQECEKKGVPFVFICNATPEDIAKFKKKQKINVPIFSMDEIELKIISRSNPAMLVLEKAVVKAKYPHRSIPTGENFKEKHLK